VHGTEAGLPSLVDRLVAELLSRSAGEDEHRLAHLASTSLPALRTFLEARAAHRRGDYEAAIRDYGLALDLDPEFALAGLGILQVTGWVGGSAPAERRGREVARQHHARLSERDRAGLGDAFFDPEPRGRTARDHLEAREEALRRWPHHPRLWYSRGDLLFHLGGTLGVPSWPDRARESFERAIELDPDFAEPVHHLASQLFWMGDTAALRRLTERQLTRHRSGPVADYLRWLARHALDDTSTFGDVALEVMDTDATLRWIGIVTQDEGFGLEDGARAVNLRLRRPGIRDELFERRLGGFSYALNGGRPVEALQHLQSLTDVQPDPGVHLRLMILSALYADGDAQAAEHAALALSHSPAGDPLARLNACVAEQWRAAQASSSGARADSRPMVDESEAVPQGSDALLVCTRVLEALRAGPGDSARRQDAVERLDRLMAEGPNAGLVDSGHTEYAHLALARLHESAGDAEAALAAVRRRVRYNGWQPYLAAMLRQEGRLAAALEDFDGAARAYRHYLAFRTEPEPSMAADVEAVRVALRSIEGLVRDTR
jgi:tetratricopeptide (TPR) repeat protein